MSESKLNVCKVCGKEIASSAKSCPHCGAKNKKPFYKKWWVWVIAGIIVAGMSSQDSENVQTPTVSETVESNTPAQQETVIEYTAYNVSEMVTDLQENAMRAEQKYNKQYVEITGELNVTDSDGKYISLIPAGEMFSFSGVQCYIKNAEQRKKVAELNIGDIVTLRGKIKSTGEIMGYSLDITSIN